MKRYPLVNPPFFWFIVGLVLGAFYYKPMAIESRRPFVIVGLVATLFF